ncbi:hypothetical protein [Mangrovimonas xylaniphaga]|uniref:hypothetical protein n=1 Tax=Mangrovimonas xylaniphaga TaxID=1645915 RepID=UPI000AB2AE03|nr:hypothetical protein [Mangrovimonas xylaniphaga]
MLREHPYQSCPNGFSALGTHPNHPWLEARRVVCSHFKPSSQIIQMSFSTSGFVHYQNSTTPTTNKLQKFNYHTIKYILL